MSLEGDDGSDSEDELRIVLNGEDFKRFPVTGGGSGFNEDDDSFDQVYIRPLGSNFPNNLRVNGSTGMGSFSSLSARDDRKDNAYNQHKCLNSGLY
ncbi:hypothetical protein LWI29_013713 [Acer saccharum]|uniref:Uncharacterized protein n=1 Tax=Acer saccharum TaxID=4024 RepID=A0AA39SY81_ACESA|nr:hypothetical protein LWI29_013713 [Acer saccharum]